MLRDWIAKRVLHGRVPALDRLAAIYRSSQDLADIVRLQTEPEGGLAAGLARGALLY
jgi:hypothetical protein